MKLTRYVRTSILLAGLAILASCGGGGDDEAGAAEPFSISPTTTTATWDPNDPDACGAVPNVVTVAVSGGAAPYQIGNISFPTLITVDRTTIPKNGHFTVSFSGGCFDPGHILVVDALGRQATITLSNKLGT